MSATSASVTGTSRPGAPATQPNSRRHPPVSSKTIAQEPSGPVVGRPSAADGSISCRTVLVRTRTSATTAVSVPSRPGKPTPSSLRAVECAPSAATR